MSPNVWKGQERMARTRVIYIFKHMQTWKDFVLVAFDWICAILAYLPQQQRTLLIACVKYDEKKQIHIHLLPILALCCFCLLFILMFLIALIF